MKTESRKLKPNTVFINHSDGAQILRALCDWRGSYYITENEKEDGDEMRKRVNTAINALGEMLLQQVEAAYEELEGRYKVKVNVARSIADEFEVFVRAKDAEEAKEKAFAEVRKEKHENGTIITPYDAIECDENWEVK